MALTSSISADGIIWQRSRGFITVGLISILMWASGCGFRLRGLVIEGATPGVFVVDKTDSRLVEAGLATAVVNLTIDPGHINAKHLGSYQSDLNGRFDIPIDELGAGFLEYDIGLVCRLVGYHPIRHHVRMPGSSKRLLIILIPAQTAY